MLWMVEDARQRTLSLLEGLEGVALDWTPPYAPNTIGSLLYHIAAIEADWLYVEVLQVSFPPAIEALFPYPVRDEAGRLFAVKGLSITEHLDRLTTVRNALLTGFRDMSAEDFRRVRHFPDQYDVTPQWVLHHLLQHEAEHRGQIGELRGGAEATAQ